MLAIVVVLLNGWPFTYLDSLNNSFPNGKLAADIFVYLATFVSALSGIIYVWQNRQVFKGDK
jgi:cation transport ATPase